MYRDDHELISLINKQDEAALILFSMKHIEHLIHWIIWHGHHSGQESYFMRLLLPDFMDTVKVFAKKYKHKPLPQNWDAEFRSLNFKKYSVKLAIMVDEKHQSWLNFNVTNEQICFLNQLNDFLTKKEVEIIELVKRKVPRLENRFKGEPNFAIELECEVKVSFFTKRINGNAAHAITYHFNSDNVQKNKWALFCTEEDLRGTGWLPELENRCCYLMHELAYQSSMMEEIFNIDCISVDTKVISQDISVLRSCNWCNE